MKQFWKWCRDKFGRIVTFVGSLAAGIDVFDVTPIKQPLGEIIGNPQLASRILAGVALLCLGLSWARHQQVARRVSQPPLPPPDPSTVAKVILILCVIAIAAIAPRAYASQSDKWTQLPPSAAQAQASAMAAEAVQPSSEALTSVLVIIQCHVAVSVIDIDATGKMHQWDLDGRSKRDLTEHLQGALSAGAAVMSDNVGCPGNPAKDTPVL